MRAVLAHRYGGPEQLSIEDIVDAEPGAGEVRVAVHAAGLNALEWHSMRGDPMLVRLMTGITRPREPRLGVDMAGTVTAVGPEVTEFAVGDHVFGPATGALAESVTATARLIAPAPPKLSLTEAAALPVAGFTAIQALVDTAHIASGQRVLIHGAAGGVGHLAVQLARCLGAARVDAVTSAASMEFVAGLGADAVFDHERSDITTRGERYDVILDTIGIHPMRHMRALLSPGGTLVPIGRVHMGRWLRPVTWQIGMKLASRRDARIAGLLARWRRTDLVTLADASNAGELRPHVSRTFALDEIQEAMRVLESGRVQGKIIVIP